MKHQELGITFRELGALLGTREMLKDGTLTHIYDPTEPYGDLHLFNMGITCRTKGCGSVACIGGTMAMILGYSESDSAADISSYVNRGGDGSPLGKAHLHDLFFPLETPSHTMDQITNEMAVEAIDRYLAGETPWP